MVAGTGPTAVAALDRPTTTLPGQVSARDVTLVLTDQTFTVEADGDLRLEFLLRADLDALLGPVPEPEPEADPAPEAEPAPPAEPGTGLDPGDPTADGASGASGDAPGAAPVPAPAAPAEPDPAPEPEPEPTVDVYVVAHEPIELRDFVLPTLEGQLPDAVDSARYDLADLVDRETPASSAAGTPLLLDVTTSATTVDRESVLELPVPGLYPLSIELRQDGRLLERYITMAERTPAIDPPARRTGTFDLSILATVADPGPEPDPLDLVDARSRLLELAQLGEDLEAPITVGIPPVVAEAIRDDEDLVDRLRAALDGDESIAMPALELDPSSAMAADLVETYTRLLRDGEDVLREVLPGTPARRTTWVVDRDLSTAGATMLRDLGMQLLVVPEERYVGLEGSLPGLTDTSMVLDGTLTSGAPMAVSVVDPVSALLDPERATGRTPLEDGVAAFALLAATRLQLGPANRSVVLTTPELGIPDADVLAVIERFAAEHPVIGTRPLSFVPGSTDVMQLFGEPLTLTFPATAGPDLTARVTLLEATRVRAASTASMLPDDDPRPSAWTAELDTLISTGFDDEEVAARTAALETEFAELRADVVPPDPFTFVLTGRESEIRLRVTNEGITPLRIAVSATSDKLDFPAGTLVVTLDPLSITEVIVPVTVRSNGTFPVTVQFATPAGEPLAGPVPLTGRANFITGLGQLLTGAAVLVLASWWFSHLRARRRERLERAERRARAGHPSRPLAAGGDNGSGSLDDADLVSPDAAEAGSTVDTALDARLGTSVDAGRAEPAGGGRSPLE
jgi:hypothetical protein